MLGWFPQIDQAQCTGCGDCVDRCPTKALQTKAQKAVLAFPQLCDYCAICEDICPTSAITLPYLISFKSTEDNKE